MFGEIKMPLKLVKLGVAAVPGILEVAEDALDVEPIVIHGTRLAEFGLGLFGSLMVRRGSQWEEPLETLMLASEPLAIKSIYNLVTGAMEGTAITKEAIELKLKSRGAGQLRPGEMVPQLR